MASCAVLIETSWNVKTKNDNIPGLLDPVLIETSWNVKSYAYQNFCEMYEY